MANAKKTRLMLVSSSLWPEQVKFLERAAGASDPPIARPELIRKAILAAAETILGEVQPECPVIVANSGRISPLTIAAREKGMTVKQFRDWAARKAAGAPEAEPALDKPKSEVKKSGKKRKKAA